MSKDFKKSHDDDEAYMLGYNDAKEGKEAKPFSEKVEAVDKYKDDPSHKAKVKKSISMLNSVAKRHNQLAKAATEAPIPEVVEKGMPASIASAIAKRQFRMHQHTAGSARPQPEVGTNRVRTEHEPTPVVPIRTVALEIPEGGKGEILKACKCGYMVKSGSKCPKCAAAAKITESTDFRFPNS